MRILYVLNGLGFSEGVPPGGGDKKALETAKELQKKGVKIGVLTTTSGKKVLEEGLKALYFVIKKPFFWKGKTQRTVFSRVASYFYVPAVSFSIPINALDFDIIYSTSDLFYDLLPAWFLKRKNPKLKFVGIIHHRIDYPWKRKGELLSNTLLYLSQRLGFLMLKAWADLILVPQTLEGEKIKKSLAKLGISEGRTSYFRNGVDLGRLSNIAEPKKEYEACFLGGLRPSKGIYDLVPIWQEVLKAVPSAKLLVIGGGMGSYAEKLKSQIKTAHLSEFIKLAGVLPSDVLFQNLKLGKVFITPSYEEGWGIVVIEALACGLPVVAYNLPAYNIFGEAIEKVPLGDKKAFAEKIIKLLKSPGPSEKKREKTKETLKKFSWEKAAELEYEALRRIL